MYEDFGTDLDPSQCKAPSATPAANGTAITGDRRAVDRWQYRADQVRLRQQQVQAELTAGILVAIITAALFWKVAPNTLIIAWVVAIAASVGGRLLFIAIGSSSSSRDDASPWDQQQLVGAMLTGIAWGSLGVISALYGTLLHQIIALSVLAGMSLPAYVSMQSSPKSLAAFVIPALAPVTGWFAWNGGTIQYALACMTVVFIITMLLSARKMREVLYKAFNLSSHNTELIKKLVTTRESAENAKQYAERVNVKLQQEIQERERAEEKIRASEQRMSAIFDSMQDTIYQTDAEGIIQWATPSIKQLLGYNVEELVQRSIKEFYLFEDDHQKLKRALAANNGRLQNFETRLVHKNGTHIWVSENSHFRYGVDAMVNGIEGTIRDTTALRHAREALQQEKERAQVTLGSIGDGVITTDLEGNIEYMNTVAQQSTGWKVEDARGKPILKVFRIVDEKNLEPPPDPGAMCLQKGKSITLTGHLLLIHRFRNQRLSIELNASPIRDSVSEITGVVLVFHDVTELRGLARKMSYQATHDSLTGLLNRREFENRLNLAVERTRKNGGEYALCYLDLDNFKVVNDTSGHIAGDELLKQLTIRLRMELRDTDIFARLGGDEFGILLENYTIAGAQQTAEAIRHVVENFRFVWDNTFFRIGVSIGLVPITECSGTMTEILSASDSACYVAKEQGRNRIHVYEPNDEAVAQRHGQMQWIQRIQNVLEENRFRLFFQPIAKLSRESGEPNRTHGEVLIRMLDEHNKLVGPGSFIPAAERYLLMPAIDRWVVSNTFRMLTLDKKRIEKTVSTCCINLSGQSLSDERFVDFLMNEIRESGVSPGILCFEITETAVIANLSNASRFISTFRNMGCRFALDDFGVGLSSFGYLKNLPVDYLKLDGCFVQNMVSDNIDRAMVEAINQIGHTMDIKTIAEFVESNETLEAVREIGVDYAQGYIISKPVPIEIGLYNEPVDFATIIEEAPMLRTVS
jgi:diguanylate cyclase (GGDEF)-like protein/PAS domain S-box-containing protein